MSVVSLTAREQQLLCAVIELMKAEINWPAVAEKASFNTAKQARDKWPSVKAKLIGGANCSGGGGGGAVAATPAKKRKAATETPVKTASTKKAKKGKIAAVEMEGSGDDSDGKAGVKDLEDGDEDVGEMV